MRSIIYFFISIFLMVITSCTLTPQLYPNSKYRNVGKKQAMIDIKNCENNANKFLQNNKLKKIVTTGTKSALVVGSIGFIGGLFSGDVLKGLAAGSSIGATYGALTSSISPNILKQNFIEKCLQKQGYEIIGWQ